MGALGLRQPDNAEALLAQKAAALNIKVHGITSGLTPQGSDLGSRHMKMAYKPEILLIGGTPISQYVRPGSWHYLDTQEWSESKYCRNCSFG